MAGIVKELLKDKTIDKDTKARTYSYQDYLIFEIEYKGGRLMIVKNYQDTVEGRKQLETFQNSIKSGEDVENYFKLKGALKMSLESVVKEVKQNRKFADQVIDLEKANPSTITGLLARQKSAKERLKQLYTQYKGQLKTEAMFVVVSGDNVPEFVDITGANTEFVFGNADSFYEDLANRIDPQLYKNPVRSGYIMSVMANHFEGMASDLDITSYPQIISSNKTDSIIKTKDEVLALVKKVFNEQMKTPEVAALYVFEKLARNAFQTEFEGNIFPVLITCGADTAVAIATGLKTLNPRVFTVAVGDNGLASSTYKVKEVNEKTVMDVLTKIKKTIKGKNPQKGKN